MSLSTTRATDFFVERRELDDGIETVAELRREHLLQASMPSDDDPAS